MFRGSKSAESVKIVRIIGHKAQLERWHLGSCRCETIHRIHAYRNDGIWAPVGVKTFIESMPTQRKSETRCYRPPQMGNIREKNQTFSWSRQTFLREGRGAPRTSPKQVFRTLDI